MSTELRLRADLERIGRELGLAVTFVDDLRKALATISTTQFDVVILGPELVDHGLRAKIVRLEDHRLLPPAETEALAVAVAIAVAVAVEV